MGKPDGIGRMKTFIRILSPVLCWTSILLIVFLSDISANANGPRWLFLVLLAPAACCVFDVLTQRADRVLSRITLAFLMCFLLLACGQSLPIGGLEISVTAILFVLLCVSHLIRRVPDGDAVLVLSPFIILTGVVIVLPMLAACLLVSWKYGTGWGQVSGLVVNSFEVGIAMMLFFVLMRKRMAQIAVLCLVFVKCVMGFAG